MSKKDKKVKDDTYQVGYGRPPRHSQFQPGQSGNRKGRPRKQQSLRSILRKLGEETAVIATEKGDIKITSNEWMLRALRQRALKGDNRATAIYLDLWLDAYGLGQDDDERRDITEEDRAIILDAIKRLADDEPSDE